MEKLYKISKVLPIKYKTTIFYQGSTRSIVLLKDTNFHKNPRSTRRYKYHRKESENTDVIIHKKDWFGRSQRIFSEWPY